MAIPVCSITIPGAFVRGNGLDWGNFGGTQNRAVDLQSMAFPAELWLVHIWNHGFCLRCNLGRR